MEKEKSYTEAINELEEIVNKLQDNDCEVDKLREYASRSI